MRGWLVAVAVVLAASGCAAPVPTHGSDAAPSPASVVPSGTVVPSAVSAAPSGTVSSAGPSASGTLSATPPAPPKDTRRGTDLDRPFTVDGVIVVSAKHRLGAGYRPKVVGAARLTAPAAKAYEALARALRKAGGRVLVVSGYRSHAAQKALYASTLRRFGRAYTTRYVAVPGTSEHQTGLAVDLRSPSGRGTTFDRTREWRWLRAHAQDYGFVLRYPKDGTAITGIGYEPWHWRYVGVAHARAVRALGANVTLEEYLGLARTSGR